MYKSGHCSILFYLYLYLEEIEIKDGFYVSFLQKDLIIYASVFQFQHRWERDCWRAMNYHCLWNLSLNSSVRSNLLWQWNLYFSFLKGIQSLWKVPDWQHRKVYLFIHGTDTAHEVASVLKILPENSHRV